MNRQQQQQYRLFDAPFLVQPEITTPLQQSRNNNNNNAHEIPFHTSRKRKRRKDDDEWIRMIMKGVLLSPVIVLVVWTVAAIAFHKSQTQEPSSIRQMKEQKHSTHNNKNNNNSKHRKHTNNNKKKDNKNTPWFPFRNTPDDRITELIPPQQQQQQPIYYPEQQQQQIMYPQQQQQQQIMYYPQQQQEQPRGLSPQQQQLYRQDVRFPIIQPALLQDQHQQLLPPAEGSGAYYKFPESQQPPARGQVAPQPLDGNNVYYNNIPQQGQLVQPPRDGSATVYYTFPDGEEEEEPERGDTQPPQPLGNAVYYNFPEQGRPRGDVLVPPPKDGSATVYYNFPQEEERKEMAFPQQGIAQHKHLRGKKKKEKVQYFYYDPRMTMKDANGNFYLPPIIYDSAGRPVSLQALSSVNEVYIQPPAATMIHHNTTYSNSTNTTTYYNYSHPNTVHTPVHDRKKDMTNPWGESPASDSSIIVATVGVMALLVGALSARRLRNRSILLHFCIENENINDSSTTYPTNQYNTFQQGWKGDLEKFDV